MTLPPEMEKIADTPAPTPQFHPRMSAQSRAAQFAPFAALSGFGGLVAETARLTEDAREVSEDVREENFRVLTYLRDRLSDRPPVRISYFVKDGKKEGGQNVTRLARLTEIDDLSAALTLDDGTRVPFAALYEISPADTGEE